METLDRETCLRLLASVPVGRVGVSIGALPAVLPVNFVLVGTTIVVRTVPGTKLDAAMQGAVVAFEADSYALDGSSGWSVMVQGRCFEVTEPASLAPAIAQLESWALDGSAQRVIRIEVSFISGRQFQRRR